MSNKNQPIGMPQQCIDTGKALVSAYGKDRATKFIQSNIDSLRLAFEAMKETKSKPNDVMKIALQSDFWSQTLESINNYTLVD